MLNAASFASYCRSRGLKCVVRDDVDSRSGNIAMIFSDESGKLPDVRVSLDFCIPGAVGLICAGFAPYNGTPERKEVLRHLNTANAAGPFANFLLNNGEIVLQGVYPVQLMDAQTLTELIFFSVRLCCGIPDYVFAGTKNESADSQSGAESNCQDKDGQPGEETDGNEK